GALLAVVLAVGALLARLIRRGNRPGAGPLERLPVGVGLGALLVMPTAWALSSVLVRGGAGIPSADIVPLRASAATPPPRARARLGEVADRRRLIAFLEANRHGERFL